MIFKQLIVPEQFRELETQWAHKSIMTGHLSIRSSVHKILSEYYLARHLQRCKSLLPVMRDLQKAHYFKVLNRKVG